MKKNDFQKVLTFPSQYTTAITVSIHPDLWAEAVRPTSLRDLRLGKIADLREAIASGAYCVSAADLAGKLIQHMCTNA
jgi:anti-sigma28 factor (negative regulator of flagellin synthesis)